MNFQVTFKYLTIIDYVVTKFSKLHFFGPLAVSTSGTAFSCLPLFLSGNQDLIFSEPVYLTYIGSTLVMYSYSCLSGHFARIFSEFGFLSNYQNYLYSVCEIIDPEFRPDYRALVYKTLCEINSWKENAIVFLIPSILFIPIGIVTFCNYSAPCGGAGVVIHTVCGT